MARFVFDVDDSLHVAFKLYALKNGSSMQQIISDLMRKCVDSGVEMAVSKNGIVESKAEKGFDVAIFRNSLGLKTKVRIIDDLVLDEEGNFT